MVTKLEDKLYKQRHEGKSYIDFEKNELLKGLNLIDPLHKAIVSKQAVELTYKSFKARGPHVFYFSPYLLKEYRNRWFVMGLRHRGKSIVILALDRFEHINLLSSEKYLAPKFDVHTYFNDVIGVSKTPGQKPQTIVMSIVRDHAPYITTKPMHSSQKILDEDQDTTTFSIEVCWNFELEREILGFGEYIRVISPEGLARKMAGRMTKAMEEYYLESNPLPTL